MNSNATKMLKNSTIYAIGNLLLKAFNILIIPIYLNMLSADEYGKVSLLTNFINVMVYIAGFSLYSAIMRFYTDIKNDKKLTSKYFSTIVWFMYISGVFFGFLCIVARGFLEKYIFKDISFSPHIICCIICVIFSMQYNLYHSILRSLELAAKYMLVSLMYVLVYFFATFIGIGVLKLGLTGAVYALLVSYIVCSTVMIVDMYKMGFLRFHFDRVMLMDSLKYSIPLIPHNLSAQITQLISKILIQSNRTYAELGVFNLASQFGMITDLIQNSISMAIQPWFYEQMKLRSLDWKEQINKILNVIIVCYVLLFSGLTIFAQEVIFLISRAEYHEAWKVVPLIVFTYVIKTPYYFYINVLFYHKQATKYIFTATLSSSIINMILSYYFIDIWGMYGSVAADMIAMLIRIGIVIFLSIQVENIGLSFKKFIELGLYVSIFSITGLSSNWIFDNNDFYVPSFMFKVVIYILMMLLYLKIKHVKIGELLKIIGKKGNR